MNPTIWWTAYWLNIIVTALALNPWTAIAACICIGGFALAEHSEASEWKRATDSPDPARYRGSASGRY